MDELMKPTGEIIAPITGSPSAPAAHLLPSKKILLTAALLAAWLVAAAVALYLKRTQLLLGFDGGYTLNLAHRQFEWDLPLFSESMDWFQGLGDVYFDVNFRLLPSFIAASIFANTTAAKVTVYEVVVCELSLAIVLFGITLGATRAISIAAALVTCITFLPFSHPALIYGILSLAPEMGSLIAGGLLAAIAFLRFGRRNWQADLPFALIAIALLSWSALVSITTMLLAAPFLLLCAISGIIAAGSSTERRCKFILVAVAGLLLIACGPAIYLVSNILDTAAVVFPAELANSRASFMYASILFHWDTVGPAGPVLMGLGIAGAVLAAFDRSRGTLRIFAITLLTYLATRLTFAMLVIFFDFWRGPGALYFEFYVIPLYAIFAAHLCGCVLDRLWRLSARTRPSRRSIETGLVGGAILVVLALAISTSNPDFAFPYPPTSTPITDILSQETGLTRGAEFRGRTASMIGRSIAGDVNWYDLHAIDGAVTLAIGNELRLVGLHYFGIPGFFQYTPTISPFLYALTSRLLALPGDKQTRNIMVLRQIDPRVLAMLGVRFVVTDRPYDGAATLRANVSTRDRTLLLYELATPNVGDYSPTTVNTIATAGDIIARLADPDFDPTRQVSANIPANTIGLVPAHSVRLNFEGASLRLRAESDGRSVLLVPLEFSRCLEATPIAYEKPLLFRANLLETGVLFSGRLDTLLRVRTGPFLNPACRLRDFFDARALGVGKVPRGVALTHSTGD
jgi:hypothetical protein